MSKPISLRLAIAVLVAAPVFPLTALGQSPAPQTQGSQTESVADAARRAREQKKAAAKQPSPVITNDTLKPAAPAAQEANAPAPAQLPDAAPQPGADSSNAPSSNNGSSSAATPAAGANADDAAQAAKSSPELTTLKQQIADEQKSLDLLQRELALEQDNVYSKTNYASDTAGKAKLDAMLAQITDKQQSVDALKARLAALLGSLGTSAPAAPATPPAAPPQP
jgi:uncharacterized coiled-coil protein SlyX